MANLWLFEFVVVSKYLQNLQQELEFEPLPLLQCFIEELKDNILAKLATAMVSLLYSIWFAHLSD